MNCSGNMSCASNMSGVDNVTGPHGEEDEAILSVEPDAYVVPIVFSIIFVVGIIGNGTLIFIVLHNKAMRSTPNTFIVSLAVGDLLLILVSVPFTASTYILNNWIYGVTICKINEFLQAVSLGVSVFTLTALSGDRYMAIVHPMRRHRGSKTMRTIFIAVAIWLLAVLLGVLELVASDVNTIYGPKACSVHPVSWGFRYKQFHTILRFVVYFAVPMSIITFFYISMSCTLWTSGRRLPGESPIIAGGGAANQQAHQLETRKKVAKLVLSLILVFMVCWLPRHIYLIWFYLLPGNFNLFWFIFKMMAFCLCFINSCINPLALYVLSEQFRRYYNHYLCCCGRFRITRGPGYTNALNSTDMTHLRVGNSTCV